MSDSSSRCPGRLSQPEAPWLSISSCSAGLWMFYAFAALSVFGALRLRRKGVPIFPMLAVALDVVVAVLLTYGQTRFRATLEPLLVLLSAVTFVEGVAAFGGVRRRWRLLLRLHRWRGVTRRLAPRR